MFVSELAGEPFAWYCLDNVMDDQEIKSTNFMCSAQRRVGMGRRSGG
jgi:hypothetical protein